MTPKIDSAGVSDRGMVRSSNQDQYLVADLSHSLLVRETSLPDEHARRLHSGATGVLAVVADGMGGHAGGETASAIALTELEHFMLNTVPWCFRLQSHPDQNFESELREALKACQRRIEEAIAQEPALSGMGTTLTMAYIVWPRLYVLHVGDSRCYVLRQGKLTQLTTDHTVAQKLVEEGVLKPEEVKKSGYNHLLWNALGGGSDDLRPQIRRASLKPGDTLMLCTDGLTGHVADGVIREVLQRGLPAREASRELVRLANEGGGKDNITVAVVRVEEHASTPATLMEDLDTQVLDLRWALSQAP